MLINSPNISGSLRVSGNTVITGSLTTSIAALGTPATTFLTSNNGTIRSRTAAQTLSDIGGQASGSYLTVSSATGSYVPYTGATASVNLGYNSLAASNINIDGNAPTAGSYLGFKQATTVNTGVAGYTSISTFGTNKMTFSFAQPTGYKSISFTVSEITQDVSGGRVYTMPDSSGTIALTTNLGSYIPLTGGAITGSLIVTGGITGNVTGSATTASYVEYSNVANKPTLVSSSVQVKGYNVFATTGSNQFNGSQSITGSLTVTGQVIAQTLNVQEVTSSIVFSSGSNRFGNNSGNKHQFTGSVSVTGSLAVAGAGSFSGTGYFGGATVSSGLTGASELIVQNELGIQNGDTTGPYLRMVMGGVNQNITLVAGAFTGTEPNLLFSIGGATRLTMTPSGSSTFNLGSGEMRLNRTGTSEYLKLNTYYLLTDGNDQLLGSITGATSIYAGSAVSPKMTITSGGNVGIGTASPTAKLQITNTSAGAATIALFLNNYSTTINTETRIAFAANTNDDIATNRYSYISALNTSTSNGQALLFATNETGASAVERMRITSGGLISINGGSTTYHQVSIKSNSTATYAGLGIYPTSGDRFINIQHTGAQGFIEVDFAGSSGFSDLVFKTGGSPRMTITSGGNVLINTTSDNGTGAKLQVAGDLSTEGSTRINGTVQFARYAANSNITTSITFASTNGFWANNAIEILVSRANNLAPSGMSKILVSMNQLNSSLSSVSTTTVSSLGTGVGISTSVSGATITITLQTHTDSASRSVAHFNVISYFDISVS
jgi:hypothetical protein